MIIMCGPTWNSLPLPIACDLLGTQKPPYIYDIPTLCILGVRPAILSLMNCRKTWSKQPGSSCGPPGRPGRHVHALVPLRNTRNSPPAFAGQSRSVASFVMKGGPALSASAIFSASVVGWSDVAVCAPAANVTDSTNKATFITDVQENRLLFMPSPLSFQNGAPSFSSLRAKRMRSPLMVVNCTAVKDVS